MPALLAGVLSVYSLTALKHQHAPVLSTKHICISLLAAAASAVQTIQGAPMSK